LPADRPGYTAQVVSVLFDGAASAVLLRERQSGAEIRVALPQTGRFADLRVDEEVHFSFDPARAACFAAAGPADLGHGD
jgi:spermidine/putrescine transport system ATP-binding protein